MVGSDRPQSDPRLKAKDPIGAVTRVISTTRRVEVLDSAMSRITPGGFLSEGPAPIDP